MTTLARMDISVPNIQSAPVADVRPRVESVQGVTAVTEQVAAPPQAENTGDQNTGNQNSGSGAGNAAPQTGRGVYFDKDIQTFVHVALDDVTGRVVQTYPDEAALARMARAGELVGKMLDTKS